MQGTSWCQFGAPLDRSAYIGCGNGCGNDGLFIKVFCVQQMSVQKDLLVFSCCLFKCTVLSEQLLEDWLQIVHVLSK